MTHNQQIRDRYDSIGKRDFKTSLIRLLEKDYKVLGSRRVLMMLSDDIEQFIKSIIQCRTGCSLVM